MLDMHAVVWYNNFEYIIFIYLVFYFSSHCLVSNVCVCVWLRHVSNRKSLVSIKKSRMEDAWKKKRYVHPDNSKTYTIKLCQSILYCACATGDHLQGLSENVFCVEEKNEKYLNFWHFLVNSQKITANVWLRLFRWDLVVLLSFVIWYKFYLKRRNMFFWFKINYNDQYIHIFYFSIWLSSALGLSYNTKHKRMITLCQWLLFFWIITVVVPN